MELPTEVQPVDPPACVHHWMLGSPVSGVTTGLCRACGAARVFTEAQASQPYQYRGRGK